MGGKTRTPYSATEAPPPEAGIAVAEAQATAAGRCLPAFSGGTPDSVLPVHSEGPLRPLAVRAPSSSPSRERVVGLLLFAGFEAIATEEEGEGSEESG